MHNLIVTKETPALVAKSKEFGFTKTSFVPILTTSSKKELQRSTGIYQPPTEDLLRFALEKTPVRMFIGFEAMHGVDSVHYPRVLDQILCKIAAQKDKTFAFSFSSLLHHPKQHKVLTRWLFAIKLCKKYKVKMYFGSFASTETDLRAARDLWSFWELLGGRKEDLTTTMK